MNKKSFVLYQDQGEVFNSLNDEQAGKLIKAIFDYSKGKESELNSVLTLAFIPIKQTLNRDNKKWRIIRKARKKAGRLGGLKRVENETLLHSKSSKIKQDQANQAVNVNVSVNDIYKKTSSNKKNLNFLRDLPIHELEELSKEFNVPPAKIKEKAIDLVYYCESHGKTYKNYEAFLKNAIRRDLTNLKNEEGGYISGETFNYPK